MEKAHSVSILVTNGIAIPENLYDENSLFQVWQSGRLVARSTNAPAEPLIQFDDGFHVVSYASKRWRTVSVAGPAGEGYVIVAQRFDVYTALTEGILLEAILPIIWVLPLLGILVWFIVLLGLKPLDRLANALSRKAAGDFSVLDDSRYPNEMKPIVGSLNQLFHRLYEAFEREKRFSADAAHELKTPLATLRVGLHNLGKGSVNDTSLRSINNTVDRMGHSIEQLLVMHRVSLEKNDTELEECDLNKITQTVISDMYDQIEAKQQSIELTGERASILGEPFSLSVLLRNLIDNASKYTPDKGAIRITIRENSTGVSVVVEDSGPGIPASEYARVTERFYRVGGDQHSSGVTGSGLGLSIVSFVTHLHHGKIVFSLSAELGGLAIEIIFPAVEESRL